MGAIISRWMTKLTPNQQEEIIDKEIQEREELMEKYPRLQKLWIFRFVCVSYAIYVVLCLMYLPGHWLYRVAVAQCSLLYLVLVWLIKELFNFLFCKLTDRNKEKLEDLKVSKKQILEDVMETETYKNAKVILERFAPEAKRKADLESTPVRPQETPRPEQDGR